MSVFVARVAIGVSRARVVIAEIVARKPTAFTPPTDVFPVLEARTIVVIFGTDVIAEADRRFFTDALDTRTRSSDILSVLITGSRKHVLATKARVAVTVGVRRPCAQYAFPQTSHVGLVIIADVGIHEGRAVVGVAETVGSHSPARTYLHTRSRLSDKHSISVAASGLLVVIGARIGVTVALRRFHPFVARYSRTSSNVDSVFVAPVLIAAVSAGIADDSYHGDQGYNAAYDACD